MRLQPLQAIVASKVLMTVNKTVAIRNKNAQVLDSGLKKLSKYVRVPDRPQGYKETFSLYMASFDRRDELLNFLNESGIEAKIHYKVPLHLQNAASNLGYREGDFPIAEKYAREIMTIPVHQYISEEQLAFVLEMVEKFYTITE
jgi:dTDP-4-amino-4,6-dideoxygalactose transaminase